MCLSGYDEWKLVDGVGVDSRKVVSVCISCRDDIYEGDKVWRDISGEYDVCSLGCLVQFTSKYDVDIDDFTITITEGDR